MSSRSCSSPSKKDSARGGIPSTQLVLDTVSVCHSVTSFGDLTLLKR